MPRVRNAAPDASLGQRMYQVAAAMFRRQGYAQTSTRELATRLGVQSGSLYHYIKGKEDLLFRVCSSALTSIDGAVRKAIANVPIERKVEVLIRRHLLSALTESDAHATMLVEMKSLSPERKEAIIKQRDQYEELIRATIDEAQVAGVLRKDIDAKYLSLSLLNLLNWSIFWFDPKGPLSEEQLCDVLTQVFLSGAQATER